MTREEAIKVLEMFLYKQCDLARTEFAYDANTVWEAVNIANKALEQEPTAKNDLGVDCIDRAELLKAMNTWDKFGYTETGCFVRAPKNDYVPYVHYDDMVKCVKGMPSVTPKEPKTGHWIRTASGSFIDDYRCDCCNNKPPMKQITKMGTWGWDFTDFCPNCGAKMAETEAE